MKKRWFRLFILLFFTVPILLTEHIVADAVTTSSTTTKSISTNTLGEGLGQYHTLSISDTYIILNYYYSENRYDGEYLYLRLNNTEEKSIVNSGEGHVTLNTAGLSDGMYELTVLLGIYDESIYNLQIKSGKPSFYFECGGSEKSFYEKELSKINPEEYNSLPSSAYGYAYFDDVKSIVDDITKNCLNDESKVLAIHDWIATNIQYDYAQYTDEEYDNRDIFIKRRGMCGSYSNLALIMFRIAGIPSVCIEGYTGPINPNTEYNDTNTSYNDSHMWNAVYVNNKWHHIDITWDSFNKYYGEGDSRNREGLYPHYRYYCQDPMLFSKTHVSFNYLRYDSDVKGIRIESYDTEFNIGEKFDFSGKAYCVLENGDSGWSEEIHNKKLKFSGYDMSKTGTQTVTVSYGPFSTKYNIIVVDPSKSKETTQTKIEPKTIAKPEVTTESKTEQKVTSKKVVRKIKKANPLKVKSKKRTYKRSKLKSKKTFSIGAKKGKGKITYSLSKAAKKAKIKVNKKGKVTIPKKCKKGTYKITVKAAGNKSYKSKKITIKIIIK